jgi:hypothetical protein
VAATSTAYVPAVSPVGSNVATVDGGAPDPDAKVTDEPEPTNWSVTKKLAMGLVAGGLTRATIGVGPVTAVPSAGEVTVTTGGAGPDEVPPGPPGAGIDHVTLA